MVPDPGFRERLTGQSLTPGFAGGGKDVAWGGLKALAAGTKSASPGGRNGEEVRAWGGNSLWRGDAGSPAIWASAWSGLRSHSASPVPVLHHQPASPASPTVRRLPAAHLRLCSGHHHEHQQPVTAPPTYRRPLLTPLL